MKTSVDQRKKRKDSVLMCRLVQCYTKWSCAESVYNMCRSASNHRKCIRSASYVDNGYRSPQLDWTLNGADQGSSTDGPGAGSITRTLTCNGNSQLFLTDNGFTGVVTAVECLSS
ncbi:hypothetical protein M3Y97_01099900 [Aphelenchoides bicaudatus]|nr:hypothetical protein M3Y97_01099900 [Aphelenchoides bicaudatus]